jgi:hypothetical protein
VVIEEVDRFYLVGCPPPRRVSARIKLTINPMRKTQNMIRKSQAKLTKNHPKPKTAEATRTMKKKIAKNNILLPPLVDSPPIDIFSSGLD